MYAYKANMVSLLLVSNKNKICMGSFPYIPCFCCVFVYNSSIYLPYFHDKNSRKTKGFWYYSNLLGIYLLLLKLYVIPKFWYKKHLLMRLIFMLVFWIDILNLFLVYLHKIIIFTVNKYF